MRNVQLFFLLFTGIICAQVSVSGTILDKSSGLPVPFANIGIAGKPIGTVADADGNFSFKIAEFQKSDSIKVSSIGYRTAGFLTSELQLKNGKIFLEQWVQQLGEVVIRSKKLKHKVLGTKNYSKNNCTGFADIAGNWKGSETAVYIKNKKDVYFESFSFFIIQNKYRDSLLFRLMFYERIPGKIKGKIDENENWVGATFLRKPIIFKIGIKQGEFTLPLQDYNIQTSKDFFVSLECLMDEMEITQFCYAGSVDVQSYFKVKAFSNWHKTHGTGSRKGGGGADFNLSVSYSD